MIDFMLQQNSFYLLQMIEIFQSLNSKVIVNILEKRDKEHNHRIQQYITDLMVYCRK